MSKDLIEFLCARLDEDEQAALDWQSARLILTQQYQNDPRRQHVRPFRERVTDAQRAEYRYSDRFDPDRALRDVAADRKLIARYTAAAESHEEALQAYAKVRKVRGTSAEVDDAAADVIAASARTGAFLAVVEDRAARFADHEDFKPEWRP